MYELDVDNLVIFTIDTNLNRTITPVSRMFREILKILDGKTEYIFRKDVDRFELRRPPRRIIQVYDTHYFPHPWLVRLYEKYKDSQIYYISFDYLSSPYSSIAKIFRQRGIVIGNSEKIVGFKPYKYEWVNLNVLNVQEFTWKDERLYDIIYWGRFRRYRIEYFRKYFREIYISTTSRNVKKFEPYCANCIFIPPIDWRNPILKYFKTSIYIEDPKTHIIYNYLGSRWYEAISCGGLTVFDECCRRTIELSGYEIPDELIISDRSAVRTDVHNYKPLIETWHSQSLTEKQEVLGRLKEIFNQ